MAIKPFEPKGDVARWVPVYDRLKDLGIGEMILYTELSELAGVDITEDRSPFFRAARELLEQNQRAMTNVPGEGYVVAHPSAQSEMARLQTRKADRRIQAAIRLLNNADLNHLTPQQRHFNETMSGALKAQRDMTRRLSRRQDRLEDALKAVRRETKATTADLAERLERLEQKLRNE